MLRSRPTRQWAPLTALLAGLVGAAIGAVLGYPNSWWFFLAGVGVAVVWAVLVRLLDRCIRRRSRA